MDRAFSYQQFLLWDMELSGCKIFLATFCENLGSYFSRFHLFRNSSSSNFSYVLGKSLSIASEKMIF